jgi:hypothetical protein
MNTYFAKKYEKTDYFSLLKELGEEGFEKALEEYVERRKMGLLNLCKLSEVPDDVIKNADILCLREPSQEDIEWALRRIDQARLNK